MTASPPAAPGMPGEEEIKGLLLQFHADTASAWRHEREGIAAYAARAILSLIRPAFEQLTAERDAAIDVDWVSRPAFEAAFTRASTAEAKLAQAVEALEPLAKIDCPVEGGHAFDPWHDDRVVFGIGAERIITAGDLRRARLAASDVRGEKT